MYAPILVLLNGCSAEGTQPAPVRWKGDASAIASPAVPHGHQTRVWRIADEEVKYEVCLIGPSGLDLYALMKPDEAEVPPCPDDMILVEGKHCTKVVQRCVEWIEDPAVNPHARCRRYEKPSLCTGPRVPMRLCIDRLEAAGDDGLPLADKSWTDAKRICESQGKRLCREREWLFACEGEEARPYPYGYVRNRDVCNFELTEGLVTRKGELADHRLPVTSNPACVSPFGVQNMVGNIDEWVVLDKPHFSTKNPGQRMRSGLKGGWWGPLRNRCRPTTVDHDEVFHELQTGFRCCQDAAPRPKKKR